MSLLLDLRHGLRRLRNSPGFTVLATLCLGIGIGASVGVFSILHALLLRPLPEVAAPWEMVTVLPKRVPMKGMLGVTLFKPLSYPSFLQYREANRVFSDLVAFDKVPVHLAVPDVGRPLRTAGHLATDNYFSALGVRAALGRTLEGARNAAERQGAVVISHELWRRTFEGRRDVLGKPLLLNGKIFQVAGVLAEGFRGVDRNDPVDLWVSIDAAPLLVPSMKPGDLADPENPWLTSFFARLAPGVRPAKAQAELDSISQTLSKEHPGWQLPGLEVAEGVGIHPSLRKQMTVSLSVVAVVVALLMLLVCANLAGLLLTQAASREREIGVRVAFGATQGRIVQQLLSESMLLGLLGGGAGIAIGRGMMAAFEGAAFSSFLPQLTRLSLDPRITTFALGLALASGLLFGLAPALWASEARWLREGASTPRHSWMQEGFVVGQIALSLVLLAGTGLFVRTWQNLEEIRPGFDGRGIVDFQFDLELQRYGEPAGKAFYDQLLERARRIPGVRSATLASMVPFNQQKGFTLFFGEVLPLGSGAQPRNINRNLIAPDYFETLGIPMVAGRDFTERDAEGAPRVAIVNQGLAKALWPGKNPVGERVTMDKQVLEVVGVAGDVRTVSMTRGPQDLVYTPIRQDFFPNLTLHVKTAAGDRETVRTAIAAVRAEVARLDRTLPITRVSLLSGELDESFAEPRVFSQLLGSTSGVALLLTGIGLYGTLAFTVRRRTREMGVRRALGAGTSGILGLVLRRGLALTGMGLAVGIAVSLLATRALSAMLFGVTPADPMVFLTVVLICGSLGAAASLLPAWSAARVSPMEALRQE